MLGGAGANVAVNGRNETEAVRAVAKEIGDRRSCIAAGDVGDFRACGDLVRSATDRFGRIDILVTYAGIFSLRKVADMEPRDWESIFRVHVFGAFNMIRHVLAGMLVRRIGFMVN